MYHGRTAICQRDLHGSETVNHKGACLIPCAPYPHGRIGLLPSTIRDGTVGCANNSGVVWEDRNDTRPQDGPSVVGAQPEGEALFQLNKLHGWCLSCALWERVFKWFDLCCQRLVRDAHGNTPLIYHWVPTKKTRSEHDTISSRPVRFRHLTPWRTDQTIFTPMNKTTFFH